jgi:hypothetical protein
VIAFNHVGTWGVETAGPPRYPWEQWLDGQVWGFCPQKSGTTAESFRRTLRERAAKRSGEFAVHDFRIHGRDWLVFYFRQDREQPEEPFSWLESTG